MIKNKWFTFHMTSSSPTCWGPFSLSTDNDITKFSGTHFFLLNWTVPLDFIHRWHSLNSLLFIWYKETYFVTGMLKYGRGSIHATQQPLDDVCRDLHCQRDRYTWTSHPALEGTFCGNNRVNASWYSTQNINVIMKILLKLKIQI